MQHDGTLYCCTLCILTVEKTALYRAILLFFFFKQKTAYEIGVRLVGSEMCIRDRNKTALCFGLTAYLDLKKDA